MPLSLPPPLLARLRDHVVLNRAQNVIEVLPLALGATNGSAELSFAAIDQENQGMGSLVNRNNSVVSKSISVDTITLDSFVSHRGITAIDLIKVDIQGGELDFLQGAANTLETLKPDLIMEVSASDLKAAGKTPVDLIKAIETFGYCIYGMTRDGGFSHQVSSRDVAHTLKSLNVFCTVRAVA